METEKPEEKSKKEERSFVVMIDCENLFKGIKGDVGKLNDFSWLIDPILEQGILRRRWAFLPDHMSMHPPIYHLCMHRFLCVVCLEEGDGKIPKQMNNVDAWITLTGIDEIEHYSFTDLVIVAGDGDYNALATKAKDYQKRVLFISAADGLSGLLRQRFETMIIK